MAGVDPATRQGGLGRLGRGARDRVQIVSRSPFAVGSIVWREARGGLVGTLVAKATYELAPGQCTILQDPLPLLEEDAPWDQDPHASIHAPSDLALFKKAAEVVLVGSAHAPAERPVARLVARLVVGSVDKSLEVWSPRWFRADGVVEKSARKTRFPLRYEHAAGGPDTDNPVGIDFGVVDELGRRPIPSVLPHLREVDQPGDFIPTIGFGPIAPSWPPRASALSDHDRAWLRRLTEAPIPEGFPSKYFQAAPSDQWLDRPLASNERILLEGLHPDLPRLVTSLPGVEPWAIFDGTGAAPLRLIGDLLYVDTDRGIATLTFRAQVVLDEAAGPLRVIVVDAPMGVELGPDAARRVLGSEDELRLAMPRSAAASGSERPARPDQTGEHVAVQSVSALPFSAPPAPSPSRGSYAPPPDNALPFRSASPSAPPPPAPVRHTPPPTPAAHPQPAAVPYVPAPAAVPPALVPPALGPPAPAQPAPAQPAPAQPAPAPSAPAQPAPAQPAKPRAASFDAAFGAPRPASAPPLGPPRAAPADAAFGSARAASDAAAAQEQARESAPRAPSPRAAPGPLRRLAVVDLLSFDPELSPRLRSARRFAPLFAHKPRPRGPQSPDEPRAEAPPGARADALRVLSCGHPADAAELRRTLADSLDDLDDFDVPLVLVAGELQPSFDEIEALRAMVSVAQPVAAGDKKLLAAIALAQEALAASTPPRPEVAANLARQIEQASGLPSLPPRYVAAQAERVLLEDRRYKRRTLLGAPRLRAELTLAGGGEPWLIYLPDAAAASLPLLPTFPVIALCEVRPREDIAEAHAEALFAAAFGRVLLGRPEP